MKPPVAPAVDGPSWVGVRVDDVPVRITQVVPGAPAAKAGLALGDEIVSIDGAAITSGPGFVERVKKTRNGDTLAIAIRRGGKPLTVKVVVEARPQSIAKSSLVGQPAPAFTAPTLTGPFSTTLADHKGSVVIVDFWATWCGPCAFTVPRLKQLHERYAPELKIVGLSSEEPATIREFVDRAGIEYAIGHDPEDRIAGQYLREGIPMFVMIDKTGIVRHVIVGADMDAVEQVLPALLQ